MNSSILSSRPRAFALVAFLVALPFGGIACGSSGDDATGAGGQAGSSSGSSGQAGAAGGSGGAASGGAGAPAQGGAGGAGGAGVGGAAGKAGNGGAPGGGGQGGQGGMPVIGTQMQLDGVTVSTLAGSASPGDVDATGTQAEFNDPVGTALDAGTVFVADFNNNAVRAVTADTGVTTTLVKQANFARPYALALVGQTLFIGTDSDPNLDHDATTGTIWSVTAGQSLATATPVLTNMGRPRGLLALGGGKLLVVNTAQNRVELFDPATKAITPIAGSASGAAGFKDGAGTAALFDRPVGAAALPDGSFVVADSNNARVRHVTPAGAVTTFAGDGVPGIQDGDKAHAHFNGPVSVAADAKGVVYVTDVQNAVVRRIDSTGQVATLAGVRGAPGYHDGDGKTAQFFGLEGLTLSPDATTLYLADGNGGDGTQSYHRIRKIAVPASP